MGLAVPACLVLQHYAQLELINQKPHVIFARWTGNHQTVFPPEMVKFQMAHRTTCALPTPRGSLSLGVGVRRAIYWVPAFSLPGWRFTHLPVGFVRLGGAVCRAEWVPKRCALRCVHALWPGVKSRFWALLALRPQACFFSSLSLSFPTCQMQIIIVST